LKDVTFEKDKLCSACQAEKQVDNTQHKKSMMSTSKPFEKKSASYGCPGVESCNLTRSQIAAIVEGGTILSDGQKVGTATPRAVPKNNSNTLSYFRHNS
jgi:hypothetical protein